MSSHHRGVGLHCCIGYCSDGLKVGYIHVYILVSLNTLTSSLRLNSRGVWRGFTCSWSSFGSSRANPAQPYRHV